MRKLTASEINQLNRAGIDPYSELVKNSGHIPVEYLTNRAEFYGRSFYVNQDVLIPRIETERIVKIALENSKQGKKISFCDVGTGSGIIGITFALELEELGIEFNAYLSDISDEAIEVAKKNLHEHFHKIQTGSKKNLFKTGKSKFELLSSNLFSSYNPAVRLDFIFANLPYIPTSRISTLQDSVRNFEPKLALDGGEDGLNLIAELLIQSYTKLKKNGMLLLEVDDTHDKDLWNSAIFAEDREVWENNILTDENSKNRYWVLKRRI